MAATLFTRERRVLLPGLLIGVALVVLVGFISLLPMGDGFARWSYDLPFSWISRTVPDDVVMVYFDPKIKANLGQSTSEPLPHRFYAQLLDKLTADGAKLVLFDILFDEAQTNAVDDARFAEGIHHNGHVVLVGYLAKEFQGNIVTTEPVPPIPLLADAAKGWGLAEISPDPADQSVRLLNTGNEMFPSVDWVAAALLNTAPVSKTARLQLRWLNYYCEPASLPSVNLDQALAADGLPRGFFRDKIVVVGNRPGGGGIAGSEREEFPTPYSRFGGLTASGPSLHAISLLNLARGDWLVRLPPVTEMTIATAWGILISLTMMRLRPWQAMLVTPVAFCLFALVAIWIQGRNHLWFSWLVPAAAQTSVALIWSVGFQYAVEARRRKKLRRAFAAYLSPHLADRIADSDFDLSLGGKEVEATVMFTDLEGFTRMSETLPPAEVSRILTSYFSETTRAILNEDGTILKYMGDAVMAVWGAPLVEPRPALRAVMAAIGMQRAGRKEIAGRLLRTRFGINSGTVLAGNLGSEFRFDYTLIGETTNLASRLEGLNKYLGTDILISEFTRRELDGQILVRSVGRFILSGATRTMEVFEVVGLESEFQPLPPWLKLFAQALEHFTKREFAEAEPLLRTVIEHRGGLDGPSSFYLKEIAKARAAATPESWDGAVQLDAK